MINEQNNTSTRTYSIDTERANYHDKLKKRKLKRILTVVLIWLLVFVYIFTPISKVNLKIEGNVYYTKEEIMNITYIDKNDYWWLVDTKKAKKVLETFDNIEYVTFKKSPFGIAVKLHEVYPLAVKDNKYVMNNNSIINIDEYMFNSKVENLISFDNIKDDDLEYLVKKYKNISLNVRNRFNNIEIINNNDNTYKFVKIYGYDEKIGHFIMKLDLVYLNIKLTDNKYDKIIGEISKNNIKYEENKPVLIAYHQLDEEAFEIVDVFKEE